MFGIVRQFRQLAGGLFLSLFLQRLLPGGTQQPDLGLLLCQQLQQGIHVPLVLEVAPVSYTHLDVYKRQLLTRSPLARESKLSLARSTCMC